MDRRASPRIPLDIPCLVALVVNYTTQCPVMIVDISRGGVQLALSPGMSGDDIAVGVPVTLRDVPGPLNDLLEGISGKIAWIGVRCCGVRLDKELSIDASDVTDMARL